MVSVDFFKELHGGSFRGQPFLVTDASTSGGRKQVKHEYPNSNKQSIEDLGFKPKNFKITAIITGANSDDNRTYLQKRDGLIAALELGGKGTLSHPFFSSSIEVVARPYSLSEKISEYGKGVIEMEFDYSDAVTNPLPSDTSISQINQKVGKVTDSLGANITKGWSIGSAFNLASAKELLGDFTSFSDSTTRTIYQNQAEANSFNGLLSGFGSNISKIISTPSKVSDGIMGIITTSGGLYSTTQQALAVFNRFFSFNDLLLPIPLTTAQRIERSTNNKLVKHAVQGSYLAMSFQVAAQQIYTTVDEIDAVQLALEDQFQKLSNDDMDIETLDLLSDLRALAGTFLENERLNASQVITIRSPEYPISVIAYQYYGDVDNLLDLTNTLVDLNRPLSDNPSFVSGDMSLITL